MIGQLLILVTSPSVASLPRSTSNLVSSKELGQERKNVEKSNNNPCRLKGKLTFSILSVPLCSVSENGCLHGWMDGWAYCTIGTLRSRAPKLMVRISLVKRIILGVYAREPAT
jgi:hypothetical protein